MSKNVSKPQQTKKANSYGAYPTFRYRAKFALTSPVKLFNNVNKCYHLSTIYNFIKRRKEMLCIKKTIFLGAIIISCLLMSCSVAVKPETTKYVKPEKTVASYEEAGKWWGTWHWERQLKVGNIDNSFVNELINEETLNFFWVHSDLKEALQNGYRFGYQDRTADLVLGPHISEAAARIGENTAKKFVEVVNRMEKDWAETLSRAIDVFITLISEGSQADRQNFINKFTRKYADKYNHTQKMLKGKGLVTRVSEGGTTLFIDARKTLAVLNIPSPKVIKTEIYQQTFRVMGDEWGRRYRHNLIKRNELIDLLRRSKAALREVAGGIRGNIDIIKESFIVSYGTDGANIIDQLMKEARFYE